MNKTQLNRLREDIRHKAGRNILHQKDCNWLIDKISAKTHRRISISTIKRFFGLIKSPFTPSKFTQETLIMYLGFKNEKEYLANYNKFIPKNTTKDIWEETRNRIMQITEHSLNSLKQKTGYNSTQQVFRRFAHEHLNNFLESGKTATFFVAPDGSGKSTIIIQLVEFFFLQKNAILKNDIVTLIDGGIFFNLYAKNQNSEVLNQLLDFKLSNNTQSYFRNHPEKQNGRIWLIIDDVDDIFFDKKRYHELAENLIRMIMGIDNGNNKVIFTCRPENMDIFSYLAHKTPYLKECLFGVSFSESDSNVKINVPPLEKGEIETLLEKLELPYDYTYLFKYHKDILHIIKNPYFLTLFIESFKKEESISEIILLKKFLQKRLFSPPYIKDKQILVDHFIELCGKGKETNSVLKDKLQEARFNDFALRELISNGVLYEYNVINQKIESKTYIKFNQNTVFNFLLLLNWKGKNPLTKLLFDSMLKFYSNNTKIQCSLIKLFVHLAIHENNYSLLKQMLSDLDKNIIDSDSKPSSCVLTLVQTLNTELIANKYCKENLIPWIFKTKIGKLVNV